MRIFLAILLINQPYFSVAAPGGYSQKPIILVQPNKSSTISQGTYDDIRIDSNSDGLIDVWSLKRDNRRIKIYYSNNTPVKIEITKYGQNRVAYANYIKKNGTFVAEAFGIRAPLEMNGEAPEDCDKKDKSPAEDINSLAQFLDSAQMQTAASETTSCDSIDPQIKDYIERKIAKNLEENKVTDCIADPKTATMIKNSNPNDLALTAKQVRLDLEKIAIGAQTPKIGIVCEQTSESTSLAGKYTENGTITFKIPAKITKTKMSSFQPLLYHELIHKAGIVQEDVVEQLVQICANETTIKGFAGPVPVSDEAKTPVASNEVNGAKPNSPSRGPSSTAIEKGGGGEGVNIAKEVSVAEVKAAVPSADKLAVNSVNMTDEGKAQAVASSQAQSAPVFAMADRAMGGMNTPALASDDSSSSSSSSSRSASNDRYQSRYNGYESSASKSRSTTSDRDLSKGVYLAGNKNTRVVEEVDLTKGNSATGATRTTNAATSGNSRMIASTGRTAAAEVGSDEVSAASAGASGASSAGSSGGGSGTYFAGASNANSNTRKTNAASRSGRSASGSADGSRDDVLSTFTGSNYTIAKDMMKETSFQQKMVEYQITVIDKTGSRWGASSGKTVFSDEGTRFIRVK